MSKPHDPFDGMLAREQDGAIGAYRGFGAKIVTTTAASTDVDPVSRKEVEEARTQKPFSEREALRDLLELATKAQYLMGEAVIRVRAWGDAPSATTLEDARAKLQDKCEEIRAGLGPKVHVVKSDPGPFRAVWTGIKKYEIRRFDRDYRVGDEIKMVEFDRGPSSYSGAQIRARIVTMTKPGDYGMPEGIGVLGIDVFYKSETP